MNAQDEKMWKDSEGRMVPASLVKPADKMKDEVARSLLPRAREIRDIMAGFKADAMAEMFAAKDLIFEQYGAKIGGKKGNFSITSYDGTLEVEVSVADRITFGPELQAAKALIDECIASWSPGANDNMIALVDHAFQVNKSGRIDTGRVLGLRKLEMKDANGGPDAKWQAAMQAISDAVKVHGTATYIRFYEADEAGNRNAVVLDFAKL
ncbi:DUF3164 family protein [Paenirhodobacter sp.]|jgi:hypothetical protein|uniref:DUF3164 family protein n=1 Tax=Paenirhodobacter sp. TaxID=1965326 RepID=UPI003B50FD0B